MTQVGETAPRPDTGYSCLVAPLGQLDHSCSDPLRPGRATGRRDGFMMLYLPKFGASGPALAPARRCPLCRSASGRSVTAHDAAGSTQAASQGDGER